MKKRDIRTGLALGLAPFVLATGTALAGTGGGTLTARTSVAKNCTVATTPVAFGNYDPIGANLSSPLNTSGSITITCVKGTTPTIGLDLGLNASGSTRRMIDSPPSGTYLNYELYQPPDNLAGTACSFPGATVWGSAGANLFSPTAAPSKAARTYSICGTVPAGQNPNAGSYTDTVTATVTF